mmetsp:Transcript_94256/g.148224  ORF Transcript_94256/g.148224 Transcript_94256/m.148224 type:complete len:236 (-) Transcript_94256:27-734(-)
MVETLDSSYFTQQMESSGLGSVSLSPEAPSPNVQQTTTTYAQPSPQPSPVLAEQFSQQVAGHIARTAAEQTVSLLRKGAGEIRVYIERNHYSVHALSFCGGLALTLVSGLGLLNVFAPLVGPLSYLLHIYQLAFGVVLCLIDGPGEHFPRAQAAVVQYIPFLHNNAGRSAFYLFIACLEGSQESWVHMLVGWYFLGIAVMHVALKFKSMGSQHMEQDEKSRELLQSEAGEYHVSY